MPIHFTKVEPRILEYYFKAYKAFGCGKTFTSMMFQELINTKNPQEGITKLRYAQLVEKAEQLDGKFGYKLLDMKNIVTKATPEETIKILKKFYGLQFVETDNFLYEAAKVFNGKGDKNNLLHQIISQIPFKKYSKSDKAKIIAALFSSCYSSPELMTLAYNLLGCPNEAGEVNTNIPLLLSVISQVNAAAQIAGMKMYSDIAELLDIKLVEEKTSQDYVISNFSIDIKQTRDVEHLDETMKMFNKKAVCLTLVSTTSNGGQAHKLRQELVLNNHVESVIALSKKTFATKTLITPVVLVLNKEKTTEQIQFINATSEDNLPLAFEKILSAYKGKTETEGFSKNISVLDVVKNGYYLDPAFYIQPEKPMIHADLNKEVQTLEKLEEERTVVASDIKEILSQKTASTKTVALSDVCALKKTRITKVDLENKVDEDCILVYSSSVKADDLGTPYYPLENYKAGDYTKVMVKDPSIKKEYLYQILSSTDFKDYMTRRMKGTIIKVVSTSDVSKYTFKLPPIQEQERIIALYDNISKSQKQLKQILDCLNTIKTNLLAQITN